MVEKVNELKELSKVMDTQIVEIKNGVAKLCSMLTMLEQGASVNSVEAMPVMVSVVKENLKNLVGSKISKIEEYTVKSNIILNSLVDAEEKPKKTRKPREKKSVEDKPARRTVNKKVEPAEVQVVQEEKIEEQ